MTSKATSPAPPFPPEETGFSGKLLIVGILAVAFIAAGGSWLFRYNATHRAAEFWGPKTAALIRDAPIVKLYTYSPPVSLQVGENSELEGRNYNFVPPTTRDISSAHGLTHLRNALLEDRNYNWPSKHIEVDNQWTQGLYFFDPTTRESAVILFSPDLKRLEFLGPQATLSCEPIADGLREMFVDFATIPADKTATPADIADPSPRFRILGPH